MRWLSFAALAVLLSGCALPPAFTVASLVADVASYASTGKSVTDHGISMMLQKDCALLRGLEGEICVEPDPERAARERLARDIRYEYPGDDDRPVLARARLDSPGADPGAELAEVFGASLGFVTDPAVRPARMPLDELGFLHDAPDPPG